MPYCAPVVVFVGSQTLPKRNFPSPISRMAGMPEYERYGDHAAEQENEVDEVLQRLAHAAVTRPGGGGLCALCRRRDVCSRHGAYFATGTAPAALMRSFAAVEVA